MSGTELNAGQREIVQTAKQSCELLLKIIDSILDYSKLEADGKLNRSAFEVVFRLTLWRSRQVGILWLFRGKPVGSECTSS